MPDLRKVHPADNTAEALLHAAKLRSDEYLSAFWRKDTTGGIVSANVTTGTAEKLATPRGEAGRFSLKSTCDACDFGAVVCAFSWSQPFSFWPDSHPSSGSLLRG